MATQNMLGYDEEELLGQSLQMLFENNTLPRELSETEKDQELENCETAYQTREGELIPVNFSKAVMYNAAGNVKGLVCLASDITDRKEAEQQIKKSLKEKEILLAEIHHRVKNNLAVISGMLQMQIWETSSKAAETALRDSQLRVQSIALVHEKLYQSENLSYIEFDKYLHDLLQAISGTFMADDENIFIETKLDAIALNINQAIPCSLLINELVVNAYKHAFNPQKGGTIFINMGVNDGLVNISVWDDGNGFPENYEDSSSESLGMSIVKTLVTQLNAEIDIYNNNGANINISFKQEEVV